VEDKDYLSIKHFPEVLDLPFGLEWPDGFTDPLKKDMYIGLLKGYVDNTSISLPELIFGINEVIEPLRVTAEDVTLVPTPEGLQIYAKLEELGLDYLARLNEKRREIIQGYLDSQKK